MSNRNNGFSLVEILLVLALIGIITGIAVPSLLGSRRQARFFGDAKANASMLRMNLADYHTDRTVFPVGTYVWTKGVPPSPNPLPNASFTDGSQFVFTVNVPTPQTYTITVTDPANSNKQIYKVNQNGTMIP